MGKRKNTDLMEDGAVEVVETSPQRKMPPIAEVKDAAKQDAGGRMAAMRAAGSKHRTDFIRVRSPTGSVQISLPHMPVFDALWRLWARKRAEGEADPGVNVAELMEEAKIEEPKLRNILKAFRRTGIARSVMTHVGWMGTRSRYYPTDEGIFAFSLAETLGHGTSVQVGGSAKTWKSRDQNEPDNIFEWSALYRGGVDPESLASE